MIAAGRLVILANLHAAGPNSPGQTSKTSPWTRRSQASAGVRSGAPSGAPGRGPVGRGRLEAELAVRRLSAALAAFLDSLLALELEDRDDVALVDIPARQATRIHAVRIRFDQHHA